MPDLNLKGDDASPRSGSSAARTTSGQRLGFLISVGTNLLALLAVIVFVLSSSSAFETVESAELQPIPIIGVDSVAAVAASVDSVVTNTIQADTAAQQAELETDTADDLELSQNSGGYTIQVSAWQSERKAHEEAERWRVLGFPVFIAKTAADSAGTVRYGVRMGRYKTFADAKRVAESVADFVGNKYTIEQYK